MSVITTCDYCKCGIKVDNSKLTLVYVEADDLHHLEFSEPCEACGIGRRSIRVLADITHKLTELGIKCKVVSRSPMSADVVMSIMADIESLPTLADGA